MTPGGIEPTTFRFVAQHLNHCATAVPVFYVIAHKHNINTGRIVIRLATSIKLRDKETGGAILAFPHTPSRNGS